MLAEIITIGDEILIGQVIDTNSAWIAEQLNLIGVKVKQISSVSDNEEHILKSLEEASKRASIIIITGGLGPTKDDITKPTLCKFFNTKLVFHEEIYRKIEERFLKMKLPALESNKKQADLPENCTIIPNFKGTASGMLFEKEGVYFISIPGVPFEMKAMMTDSVLPFIKQKFELPVIVHRTILTHGLGESFLAEKIKDWENKLPATIKLAYLPSPEHLRLRMSAYGDAERDLMDILDVEETRLKKIIPNHIFGYGKQSLQEILGKLLLNKKASISSAESCTGGNIARLITSIPGSSSYFKGSIIAYSNEIKIKLLNVNPGDIDKFGAVSEEVVTQMALGVRKVLNTDYSISTSGIAGPDGGTAEKPVGTVWIAVAGPEGVIAKKYVFSHDRDINIRRATSRALDNMRKMLLGIYVVN
ncbi:MAG: competence/damage-inducible protein A [Bacteroidales bacterium]|nr:competence/damage-inducible protein A [Bacteroidales bacterium]